jgi:NAD(P)-dependent dehydrogenase (short-subunit alcohol dehydrogenase family)
MAKMLAREGAKVAVTDVNEKDAERVAAAIGSRGGEALFRRHDVTDERAWQQVIAAILERSIDLDGVFLGTKHAIAAMKKNRPSGGSIINLSSIEGIIGDPNLGAYNASKGGVRLYTKSVALYCAKAGLGIRVNSIHPAYIWTPMVESYLREQGDVQAGRKALDALHPIGHVGEPDDIAYGAVYLASDESKFVTGAELVIDGGYTAQ